MELRAVRRVILVSRSHYSEIRQDRLVERERSYCRHYDSWDQVWLRLDSTTMYLE